MDEKTKNFIITLTGPSGCGKSTVIGEIMELEQKLAIQNIQFSPIRVPKFSTRSLRSNEIKDSLEGKEVDLISVEQLPENCELRYQTYGKKYGFELEKIKSFLDSGKTPVIIINDVRVVEELKREFPERVLSLFLFREIPRREFFINQAGSRGNVSEEETEERFNKATAIYRTFIENIGLFSRVILNPTRKENSENYAQIQIENVIKGVLSGKISLRAKKKGVPQLFIIAGNAASGKDEIIQAVNDMGKLQAIIIPKYTSRRQDKDDGEEMICQYIPREEKLKQYREEYKKELEERQIIFDKREKMASANNEKLSNVREKNLKEKRKILKAGERFWDELKLEEEKVCAMLRNKILNEVESEHILDNLNLFAKNFDELCEIYKKEGYHRQEVDVEAYLQEHSELDEQAIVQLIVKEADVENDICLEKLKQLNYKKIWDLYQKKGYHSEEINVKQFRQEFDKKILDEFFEYNKNYIDLEKIANDYRFIIEEKTKDQVFKVTGPAYYIEVDNKGLVMYENNMTLYGFEVCELEENKSIQYEQMIQQNKHCVLVASLIDIFKICKPFFDGNIITVFSYSEISSKEFEMKCTAAVADKKMENFEKEIKKYSEYIADFDHVTIYAESEYDKRNGGRTEELIDQIFRLFRYYNQDDDMK